MNPSTLSGLKNNNMDDRLPEYEERESSALTATEQRSLIFHLLYALDSFDYETSVEAVADAFKRGYGINIPSDSSVFQKTAAIVSQRKDLDALILPLIENWSIERLGVPTKLILRLALWELLYTDTDPVVIINEAVELAQCFAERDAYKFINGVLDSYRKSSLQ